MVRRRIKPISDSDSDNEAALTAAVNSILPQAESSNENSNSLDNDFEEKSRAVKQLMDAFPDTDTMVRLRL